jgi:hypothetical protein
MQKIRKCRKMQENTDHNPPWIAAISRHSVRGEIASITETLFVVPFCAEHSVACWPHRVWKKSANLHPPYPKLDIG